VINFYGKIGFEGLNSKIKSLFQKNLMALNEKNKGIHDKSKDERVYVSVCSNETCMLIGWAKSHDMRISFEHSLNFFRS